MDGSSDHSHDSTCSARARDLEGLAESFQKYLKSNGMIQDRKTVLLKTVSKCFTGSQAVSALQTVMTQQLQDRSSNLKITREAALMAGNSMVKYFHLFKHANCSSNFSSNIETTLEDSDAEFYQFDHNLPCQVRSMKRQYPSYWDKVRLLEQHVEVKDRRYMLCVFPNCFVASEAVDVMMDLKLVRSRIDAVHLMGKLNQKVFCCEHVTNDHEFKDEYLFFHFIAPEERMPEPARKTKSGRSKSPNKTKRSIRRCKSKEWERFRAKSPLAQNQVQKEPKEEKDVDPLRDSVTSLPKQKWM
ncbi:DEP domain-containing mTOR-interacting protein [Seminavis robusta]|uniref:DEP domain-containing mTOR-interacting protein n=1 Tax=Seminavis robusta TaxID=568900 RepID=A0A9N8H4D7_9STRA|nr:DEP domain-containing mTOR-interacting protein [Seminavis robusta]|eukprot:Sro60_g034460.1 DEP domain-containing mTOR-interacting protein (300) ;mRNA; r:541-1440